MKEGSKFKDPFWDGKKWVSGVGSTESELQEVVKPVNPNPLQERTIDKGPVQHPSGWNVLPSIRTKDGRYI